MSEWTHPDDVTQEDLHRFRAAAESAWGDDTRHKNFAGHANPAAGQCYVTSKWLTTHLGGHVGLKAGHYFWVSPDRSHVIDLTGDQFSNPPEDPRLTGIKLDSEDEGWYPTEEQLKWRPGPIMYKRANHPLFDGFKIKADKQRPQDRRDWEDVEYSTNERVKLFSDRANAALAGQS
jgi:hypothetical protein